MNGPTLKDALESVEFELPALDDKTQAILAAHVYKARVFEHSIDRLVSSINDLIMAAAQKDSAAVSESAVPQGGRKGFMEIYEP